MSDKYAPRVYDRQGNPITIEQWGELRKGESGGPNDYKRVAETTVGPLWVSTVWLGLDHGFRWDQDDEPYCPLIFETMAFQRPDESAPPLKPGEQPDESLLHPEVREWVETPWRYCTEAEAIAGHQEICQRLSELLDNAEWIDTFMTKILDDANATTTEGTQE